MTDRVAVTGPVIPLERLWRSMPLDNALVAALERSVAEMLPLAMPSGLAAAGLVRPMPLSISKTLVPVRFAAEVVSRVLLVIAPPAVTVMAGATPV